MLTITGLSKNFGQVAAVAELSLKVSSGQVYGLLGPNGAGKTTALRMIVGLQEPDHGSIRIDGIDVSPGSDDHLSLLGYLPDQPPIFERLTGSEHLDLAARLRGDTDLSEKRECASVITERLELADESLERYAGTYSRGMKRKLGIAIALMHKPPLIILDEPTASLDPLGIASLELLLGEAIAAGAAVLLATHNLGVAERVCDTIGVLVGGRLAFQGSPDEIRARCEAAGGFEEGLVQQIRAAQMK